MFLYVFALALLSLSAPQSGPDLSAEIARLSSPKASERAAAERSLAAQLKASDSALIEARLRAGDAEERARWIEILASEDKLAFVAASFAGAVDDVVASAGRAALRESILRWSPSANEPGIRQGELSEALSTWTQARVEIDLALATTPLEDVLDLVTRVAPLSLGIAVDRRHDGTQRARTGALIAGSFTSALRELALRHDLELVGFSCKEGDPSSERWLAFVPKRGEDDAALERARERRRRDRGVSRESSSEQNSGENGSPTDDATQPAERSKPSSALDFLLDASIAYATPDALNARSRAARAIAASGWPSGIALLAQSFAQNGDAAALEGLMLAARRGRVAPELRSSAGQTAMRAAVERALEAKDAGRAVASALALGAAAVHGQDDAGISARALDECASANGLTLFARLVEIDARRVHDAATRACLDAVLARGETDIGARFLALEIRSRFSAPIEGLVGAEEFVVFATRSGRLNDLSRWLRDARSFPPEAWRDTSGVPQDWTLAMRTFVIGAWLARGETTTAVEHLARALNAADSVERETLADAVRDTLRAADPSATDALFAQLDARADVERTRLVRFIAQAGGTLTDAAVDEALASIAQPATTREEWLVLGALAGSTRGARARTRLVEALGSAAEIADITAGLARAVESVRAKRDIELERAFENDVRTSAGGTSSRLRAQLRIGRWPAPPAQDRVRLGDLDRSAARFGL